MPPTGSCMHQSVMSHPFLRKWTAAYVPQLLHVATCLTSDANDTCCCSSQLAGQRWHRQRTHSAVHNRHTNQDIPHSAAAGPTAGPTAPAAAFQPPPPVRAAAAAALLAYSWWLQSYGTRQAGLRPYCTSCCPSTTFSSDRCCCSCCCSAGPLLGLQPSRLARAVRTAAMALRIARRSARRCCAPCIARNTKKT
jgi:hypothetical protein